ncbi:S26 family signal peptidase [Streptosporangium sp. NPDC002524]|uniref:S26 family signal peptidase n=1 Tax=Streptosporangium sp. NPDC002524 TaxID=3154537 RepID=UPI0033233E2B
MNSALATALTTALTGALTGALIGAVAVSLLAAVAAAVLLRGHLVVLSVSGPSMAPALRPGDRVLVRRTPGERLRTGDIVVVEEAGPCRPGDPTGSSRWVVKRVAAVPGDPEPAYLPSWARTPARVVPPRHIVLLGDNAEASRDSRHFGAVRTDRVLGVVLLRLGGRSAAGPGSRRRGAMGTSRTPSPMPPPGSSSGSSPGLSRGHASAVMPDAPRRRPAASRSRRAVPDPGRPGGGPAG